MTTTATTGRVQSDTGPAPAARRGAVVEDPRASTVAARFARAAAAWPDRAALSCGGQVVSYGGLDRWAARIARPLAALGCGAETVVAVCVDRSPALVAALLGVMKSGAAFLALDPQFPRERLIMLARQSGARAIVTQGAYADLFEAIGAPMLLVESTVADGVPATDRPLPRPAEPHPSTLAYVLYTSGSTGLPKAVAVTHASLDHYVRWASAFYSPDPTGVAILHSSIGFDLTMTSVFCPLVTGMRTVIIPEHDGFDAVIRLLDEGQERVGLLKVTPSHLALLPEPPASAAWDCDVLIVGGERFTTARARAWRARDPRTRIFNEYGPTEATVGCCVSEITTLDGAPDAPLSIGAAIDEVRLRVEAQAAGPPADPHEGELFIGGPCLARGYLQAAAATAEKFLPDPERAGARCYRTGDWVTRAPAGGDLTFVGRRDRQRKVNGIRIELEEIEAILSRYPGVRAAAIVPTRDPQGRELLAAFLDVGPAAGPPLDPAAFNAYVRGRVLQAVMPRAVHLVDALPIAVSGKVDYQKLLRERHSYRSLREAYAPPRNPTEERLASLWRSVLDRDEIGIDDSFFALDGNSMKTIQFVFEARKRDLPLTTRDLFERQTIRELAALIDSHALAGRPAAAAPGVGPFALVDPRDRERMPADVVDAYPLAMLQAGTLFESDSRLGSGRYHNVNSYHVICPLDVPRFEQALAAVVARHAILRTGYDYVSYREPLQLVSRDVRIPLQVIDISHLSAEDERRHVETFVNAESLAAFDWTRPPLLRFFIHIRGEGRLQVTLSKHHSILDGWSAATLVTEIVKNYFARLRDEPPPFRFPPETSYRDFVALERQALQSADAAAFWRESLRDAAFLPLRPWGDERPAPDCAHSSITTQSVPIPADLSERLKHVARRAQTPLKSALLTAHLRALAQMHGQTRLVTGVVSHGRPETPDADQAIGLFINTVPFHLVLDEGRSWLETIQQVFREECRIFPRVRYPMARIKHDLGWDRLFASLFYYTNFHVFRDFRASDDLTFLDALGFEETEIPFTAAFSLHPLTAAISLDLHFHLDHFSVSQIATVTGYYTRALTALAHEPHTALLSATVIGETEADATCSVWCDPRTEDPGPTVFDLIRAQAAVRPDATALVSGSAGWTYGTLVRQAESLAARLQAAGVAAERLVCLFLANTADTIRAMVAVNAAGGAFVVLDAAWPEERLRDVLARIEPVVILTDAALAERARGWQVPILTMSADRDSGERPAPFRRGERMDDSLAYVIFTSGSTGAPKGVMVSQSNLAQATRSRLRYYGERYERFLLLSRLTFDSAFAGVWGTLCGGGALHVMPDDGVIDVGQLAQLVGERDITHLLLVPSLYRVLLPELPETVALRAAIVAGEELTGDLVQAHRQRLPDVALYNEYGPTEGSVWATVADVGAAAADSTRVAEPEARVSIGRAVAHLQTQLLDRGMRPVSLGAAGELYLGGAGVARGYHRAPALTAERFVPNPRVSGARDPYLLYRTGDLVRQTPDGQLEFIGRADHQIKVRGVRIEPEEIERALFACCDLREAMIGVREETPGRKTLCLYYVPSDDAGGDRIPLDLATVRARLRERLPASLLPDEAIEVERLPRLSNGKVDRRAPAGALVPRRASAAAAATAEGVADPPSTEIERALAGLWREALARPDVGVRQTFFDLGGDSLLANQVVLRAEKVFGTKVLLQEFYRVPTIAAHAALLRQRGVERGVDAERVAAIWNEID